MSQDRLNRGRGGTSYRLPALLMILFGQKYPRWCYYVVLLFWLGAAFAALESSAPVRR